MSGTRPSTPAALRRLLAPVAGALVFAVCVGTAGANGPANDSFADAAPISGERGSLAGANVGATHEPGEPRHGGFGVGSVWYRWTAPFTGRVVFDTCASRFDTLLAVYSGAAVSSLTQLAANDDACALGSRVRVPVQAGATYHVAVDGFDETGEFTLGWAASPPAVAPPNDDFASARRIGGTRGRAGGTNVDASPEPGEPPYLGGTSVWFRWQAPQTLPIVFGTCGAPFDTVLVAFRGERVDALVPIAGSDDDCGRASRVSFEAQRGVVYHVAVAGFSGAEGSFELRWAPRPCVVPDVRGAMLARARRMLARGGCAVGAVRTVQSPIVPRGGVVEQWPLPGARLPYLGRVRLAVSAG